MTRPVTTNRGDVEGLLRVLAPQVLTALVRRNGQFHLCEDATQEALLAAAQQWPSGGLPDNPRGWLITVASRRLTDQVRSEQSRRAREELVAKWAQDTAADPDKSRQTWRSHSRLIDINQGGLKAV